MRSGRSTRPATTQPNPPEITAIPARATPEYNQQLVHDVFVLERPHPASDLFNLRRQLGRFRGRLPVAVTPVYGPADGASVAIGVAERAGTSRGTINQRIGDRQKRGAGDKEQQGVHDGESEAKRAVWKIDSGQPGPDGGEANGELGPGRAQHGGIR